MMESLFHAIGMFGRLIGRPGRSMDFHPWPVPSSIVGAESIVGLGSSTPPSATGVEAIATFSVVVLSL